MTEREQMGFPWETLFFVTGVSGIAFDLIIWMLDGHHTPVMLWTGITGLSLGVLSLIIKYIARSMTDKDE